MTVGSYTLTAEQQIAGPQTAVAMTPITGLDGMRSTCLDVSFAYGSGGTSVFIVVQTSLDGGNWRDVARFDFTTSSLAKTATIVVASKAVGIHGVLSSEGQIDGFLGNRLRAVLTTTGTYANTTLAARAAVQI